MIVILEHDDFINEVTPYRNGCAFRIIYRDETPCLAFGCYLLVGLMNRVDREIYRLVDEAKGYYPLSLIDPLILADMQKLTPCPLCTNSESLNDYAAFVRKKYNLKQEQST